MEWGVMRGSRGAGRVTGRRWGRREDGWRGGGILKLSRLTIISTSCIYFSKTTNIYDNS